LALVWGINWPVMKIILSEIPPWMFRAYSGLVGGTLLLFLAAASRQRFLPSGGEWRRLAVVALFNVTGFQMLISYGLMHTSAGSAALFAYTMPLWVVVIGTLMGDRLHARLIVSLLAGMAGIGLLMSRTGAPAGVSPLGTALMLGAAVCWAIGTQMQMRMRWQLKAISLAGWQVLLGCLPMVPIMVFLEGVGPGAISPLAWLCWGYTAAIALAIGFVTWFKLIELTSAQVAAIASLLAPVIGVLSGALVLGEPLGWREITATIAILLGVVLARQRPARLAERSVQEQPDRAS
jgi:drug/metabolite transporter (DMT)-like permease